MGNSQPTNRTGRQATQQKLSNAQKLGVLSLSEHSLDDIPAQVFDPTLQKKLRTLDLSKNSLKSLDKRLGSLTELKSLNLDNNKLLVGSLSPVSCLEKLQTLSVAGNILGKPILTNPKLQPGRHQQELEPIPELPASLKSLNLSSNFLSVVPKHVLSVGMTKLEKLDLSFNHLATVPAEISALVNLKELNLDGNMIVALPDEVGNLKKLKVISLRDNRLRVTSTIFSKKNPQPLPKPLFTDTLLIDLNLHGNQLTNTQVNQFDGFQEFLDRRQKVKSKTMTNLDVCGLE